MADKLLLRDLLVTTKDGDWGKDEAKDGFVPYRVIRGADFPKVREGDISTVPRCYLKKSTVHRRTLEPNDIIIETAGGNRDRPTGRTLLVSPRILDSLDLPATCASFCRFLRVDEDLADPRYVFWYLQHLYERGEMWSHQVQHTGVARFQYTRFAEMAVVPLPPRSEQRAIADILGSLDDKIELNRRMNQTLEAMARAIFKNWFIDFGPVRAKAAGRTPPGLDTATAALFPDAFENSPLGPIPQGWEHGVFTDLVDVAGGGTPKTRVPEYWGGTIPWFSVVDAPADQDVFVIDTEKKVTEAGIANSSANVLPELTTIISARGTVGRVALTAVPMAMNQSCYALRCRLGDFHRFVYYATRATVDDLRQRAHGSVFDTITRSTLKSLYVVLPNPKLMGAFERHVEPILSKIESNLWQCRTLTAIREVLLPKLLSGKLSVAAPEEVVA